MRLSIVIPCYNEKGTIRDFGEAPRVLDGYDQAMGGPAGDVP